MVKGTPIRLVQENGRTIELDAQTMVLTTSRKVGGSALPFTGSKRIGLDLNVNQAMINIQGIIADDRDATSGVGSSAVINFGIQPGWNSSEAWADLTNWAYLMSSVTTPYIRLYNTLGQERTIPFTPTSGSTAYSATGGAGSTPTVLLSTAAAVPEDVATAVAAYVTNQLSADFSASPEIGVKRVSGGDSVYNAAVAVRITQTKVGGDGNNATPTFVANARNTGRFREPSINEFKGGVGESKKSAGDKAMDLYGVLNNSVTTASRLVFSGLVALTGFATAGAGAVVGAGLAYAATRDDVQDYICGIQIPYNSTVTAPSGELYVARNFFMPTGMKWGSDKTSVNNLLPASVEFSKYNEYTGIQGSIQKMDITYDAGETVYNFNMIFAPIDMLL